MNKERVKYDFVVVNDDEEVECRRNLTAFKGISSVIETKEVEEKDVNTANKTREADVKRQNALAKKWNTLQNQKCTIANALKGESLNKKIKFDEDGDQQKHKEYNLQSSKKKSIVV